MATPTQFSKFGKVVSDLFKKDFDFGYSVKNTNKASKGLKFETAGNNTTTGVAGYAKVNYDHSDFGKVEAKVHSAGRDSDTNAKVTFNKLTKGLEVSVAANAAPDVAVEAIYKRKHFATTVGGKTNLDSGKSSAAAAVSVGPYSDIVVGGNVALACGKDGAVDLSAYNAGLEYSGKAFSTAVVSANKFDAIAVSVHRKHDRDTLFGVRLNSSIAKSTHKLDFGVKRSISDSASITIKGDTDANVGFTFQQRLSAPVAKFSFAYQRNLRSDKNQKFGLGMHFGDY